MDLAALAKKYGKSIDEVTRHVEFAKRTKVPKIETFSVIEGGFTKSLRITREGVGPLATIFGRFQHFSFRVSDQWEKYSAIVYADLEDSFTPRFDPARPIRVRVDSGCETGQLFGDKTCECQEQLNLGLTQIRDAGQGLLVSIPRQDGRGMGLPFKLATLYLQDSLGVDTVEASKLLEPTGSRDVRNYAGVIAVLRFLGVPLSSSLELVTNNPAKAIVFNENGYENVALVGCVIPPTELTEQHLLAKQNELGHIKLVDNQVPLDTSRDAPLA